MSLVGNLEDLSLGDILQIVSLSRKSGLLLLESRQRQGKIIFRDGQVVRATSNVFQENLGDILLRRQLVDLETLRNALLRQQKMDPPQPRLGDILSQFHGVSKAAIEDAVKEQVETIVYSFFGWTEGTFSFELCEPQDLDSTSLDPLQFMLQQGLNPQWLAMEGSRIFDEKRHRGESLEEEAHESVVSMETLLGESAPVAADDSLGEAKPSSETQVSDVLLFDRNAGIRERLKEVLTQREISVETFSSPGDLIPALEKMTEDGQSPVLIVDLDHLSEGDGGEPNRVDLLRNLRRDFPQLRILPLAKGDVPELERGVRALGIRGIIRKPGDGENDDLRNKGFEALGDTLVSWLKETAMVPGEKGQPLFNLRTELLEEIGEPEQESRPVKGPESPGLHLLKGMLQELNNPSLGGGIILLVLRFASELMNRAVVFLTKEREIVGLGQFGIEIPNESADERVRRMKIPRATDSVLRQALEEMTPLKMAPGKGEWDRYLQDQLGGGTAREIFLGPILSEGKVVALLYGDNLPKQTPIGDTEALEIFLSQAGLAMEKALLERRLRSRETA